MDVEVLPEADTELMRLPDNERDAMDHAFAKLEQSTNGLLPSPHSSQVKNSRGLRELRPRQGKSACRALYRRIGNKVIIGAIGPEAKANPAGFRRALNLAEERLVRAEERERRGE